MGKKSKKRPTNIVENKIEQQSEFSDAVEEKFKLILRVMSWIVGVCFVLIIILPNFDFGLVDDMPPYCYGSHIILGANAPHGKSTHKIK